MPNRTASKVRAPRNRTIDITPEEAIDYRSRLAVAPLDELENLRNGVICGDAFETLKLLPKASFDLLFADPPYNLSKNFGAERFKQTTSDDYQAWLESWLADCVPLLKPAASIYVCGDWRSSASIQSAGSKFFKLRNRITWEREKGRGSKNNWKNSAEDIWFFTMADEYTFNIDDVKIRRNVLAPYTKNGEPKDWQKNDFGNFRDTHPSNIWTDISIPFWSMPENTEHPTQKPEKLLAKIILASTNPGELILDPFAGSGTTAVTAKKLGRDFVAIESDENYCCLALKRLEMAESDKTIQGLSDGVFWERNSQNHRRQRVTKNAAEP